MSNPLLLIAVAVAAYLIGSFPTAYIVGKLNGIDIFKVGSGNMGATNVNRALGSKWGLFVLVCDALKGALAVLLGRALYPQDIVLASVVAGLAVILGHNWSFFVRVITGKLRGGKGAATSGGTWLTLFGGQWYLVALPLAAMIIVLTRTRYVSLSVLVAAATAMITALASIVLGALPAGYAVFAILFTALIFYRHRDNIERLRKGSERKLGERAETAQAK
jgi:acyl phosphate:glycerol-3-phosphate acyltransferase